MRRRDLVFLPALASCAAASTAQQAEDPLADRLRAGRCVLLLRHERTTPGVGDPPGFSLDSCSSQRNLSDEGRAGARRLGEWFRSAGLVPRAVRSSAWCRCRDTAELAFGTHVLWPPLNSTFGGSGGSAADATEALRTALAAMPAGSFEVWVTHQVNIAALTGESVAMGEGFVVDAAGRVGARRRFG